MSGRVTTHPSGPRYIDSPEEAERFLATVADAPAVAVDTEGASFHRFVDRIYLLQISTATSSAILDPLAIGKPAQLGALLESPRSETVFHDADYDLRLLYQDYGWHPRRLFDTRIAAQLIGLRTFGLAALLERYLGLKLDKKHQRADWSMRPLSRDMLEYAAQDTLHLLPLRDRLAQELEQKGRWDWAREEFERLEGTHWTPDTNGEGYQRIKGAHDLTRRELAVFRELVAWRDVVARELDRATFRVVGNEALLELARSAPRSIDALRETRGMPRGIAERRGHEVLDAIARGLAVPDDQLPRFPRAPRWERDPDFNARVNRLRGVRETAAQRLDLDPGFLISRERLELIARKRPTTVDQLGEIPDLRQWQIAVMGGDLLKALKG